MALISHKKVRESPDIFTRFQFSIVRTGFIYFFMMEQDRGFEPPHPVWKTGMLAVEHQSCMGTEAFEREPWNSQRFI